MKKFFTLVTFFILALNTYAQPALVLRKNLSTGVQKSIFSTTLIPYGQNDDGWTVTTSIRPNNTIVCQNLNGAWAVNSCARWITDKIDANNQPADIGVIGTYVFKCKFNTDNFSINNNVYLKIDCIGADDKISYFMLNGNIINLPMTYYVDNLFNPIKCQNLTLLLNPAFLNNGDNLIEIGVNNTGGLFKGLFFCGGIYVEAVP